MISVISLICLPFTDHSILFLVILRGSFFFLGCLQSLKRDRVLRMFKLNTGQDDHAIMFVDDYIKQVIYLSMYLIILLLCDL